MNETVEIAPDQAGHRLDVALTARLAGLSRARIQALIKDGRVSLGGRTIGDGGLRVKPGDAYLVAIPDVVPAEPRGEAIELTIVYEDSELIVVDKPAGLVVHPAPGHPDGTLVNALIDHCGDSLSGIGGVRRPGIVHRLDKDTSGLLVVAKTDRAHQSLSEQFASHGADGRLERSYRAVVWGVFERPLGTINANLARSTANRTKIAVSRMGGRPSVTHYRVEETFDDPKGKPIATLLRCDLETGRTHQIRVHLAHVGHPLLGDATYGTGFATRVGRLAPAPQQALAALARQALHAAVLGFEHPTNGRILRFESALPDDLQALVDALRG